MARFTRSKYRRPFRGRSYRQARRRYGRRRTYAKQRTTSRSYRAIGFRM